MTLLMMMGFFRPWTETGNLFIFLLGPIRQPTRPQQVILTPRLSRRFSCAVFVIGLYSFLPESKQLDWEMGTPKSTDADRRAQCQCLQLTSTLVP